MNYVPKHRSNLHDIMLLIEAEYKRLLNKRATNPRYFSSNHRLWAVEYANGKRYKIFTMQGISPPEFLDRVKWGFSTTRLMDLVPYTRVAGPFRSSEQVSDYVFPEDQGESSDV